MAAQAPGRQGPVSTGTASNCPGITPNRMVSRRRKMQGIPSYTHLPFKPNWEEIHLPSVYRRQTAQRSPAQLSLTTQSPGSILMRTHDQRSSKRPALPPPQPSHRPEPQTETGRSQAQQVSPSGHHLDTRASPCHSVGGQLPHWAPHPRTPKYPGAAPGLGRRGPLRPK